MALEKQTIIDRVTITQFGDLEIREKTSILEDGKELSHSFHRRVIVSGADVGGESQRIQDLYAAAQIDKIARPD